MNIGSENMMKEFKEKVEQEIRFSRAYLNCTLNPYPVLEYHGGRVNGLAYVLTLITDGIDNSCCKTCGLFIPGEDEYGICSSNRQQCPIDDVCKRWRFK